MQTCSASWERRSVSWSCHAITERNTEWLTTVQTEKASCRRGNPVRAATRLEGREVDARADIFALGAVIYEMATGRKAFEGKSQASLVAAILERDPPPISNVRPLAAPTLDGVVATCLRKKPEDRSAVSLNLFVALYARIARSRGSRTCSPHLKRRRKPVFCELFIRQLCPRNIGGSI